MHSDPTRPNYRSVNRQGWDTLASTGEPNLTREDFAAARERLDASGWLPWNEICTVLCLAAGGGVQAPLFASAGFDVTVVDISPAQLRHDGDLARAHGLNIECVEADMLDLRLLYARNFNLVYQPVSSCYIPDVAALYREVAQVVRPGGLYLVEHWLSTHIQLDDDRWDGSAYRVGRPLIPGEPVAWHSSVPIGGDIATCWHFRHPLGRLLGGLCEAGFVIERACEPVTGSLASPAGSDDHLAAYLHPFLHLLARRTVDHDD